MAGTPFSTIYDAFFAKITDDMYLEWTKEDTEKDLYNILMDSLPGFEFPRFPLYSFEEGQESFSASLTLEEINILALGMMNSWL